MCHQQHTGPIQGGSGIIEQHVAFDSYGQVVPAYLAQSESTVGAGLLLIHDIWGPNEFYHDLARRLAAEGFSVLLPDFFVREGPLSEQTFSAASERRAKQNQLRALEDAGLAIRWLRHNTATNGKVGTIGFCMGGTLAMLNAGHPPTPDAAVVFYGFPAPHPTVLAPLVPMSFVEHVQIPMLGFWGAEDNGVGMDTVRRYDEMLTSNGTSHDFTIFPNAGHGFLTFDPEKPTFSISQQAFKQTIAFFHDRLVV